MLSGKGAFSNSGDSLLNSLFPSLWHRYVSSLTRKQRSRDNRNYRKDVAQSFVADNRVIFNIGRNKYRLVTHVNYDFRIVYIKFVGTHAEYDRIDPETI